ncbi:MAG: class I SAM-dependent methyltransferase [bacterium]|nr:class I SAM-dependent methyltransferase [bacterium]
MDERTIETYNKMAGEYDAEVADFWERFPRTFVDAFAENVRKNGKVLDVGSGSGRDALILQKMGFDVVCIDASEAMIRLTTEKGLTSVLADFNSIPFENDSFDGVWAYTSLLHVQKTDVQKPISEIYRVLKGRSILGLGLIEGETEEYRESSGVNLPRYFAYYAKNEVEGILKKAGFDVFYFEAFKPRSKNYLNFLAKKGE